MTAEPKFVPEEAVQVTMDNGAAFSVRLIDCVGYMVPGAVGSLEDDSPRMVTTPWFDYEIPMTEAAEIGTRKVIAEHSTIGIVVTTDGSITDIPREDYLESPSWWCSTRPTPIPTGHRPSGRTSPPAMT